MFRTKIKETTRPQKKRETISRICSPFLLLTLDYSIS
jgi:hypothetical protein